MYHVQYNIEVRHRNMKWNSSHFSLLFSGHGYFFLTDMAGALPFNYGEAILCTRHIQTAKTTDFLKNTRGGVKASATSEDLGKAPSARY